MTENDLSTKFRFVQLKDDIKDQKFEGEAIGFFKDAMLRFLRNKASVAAAICISVIVILAIIGPSLSQYGYDDQHVKWQNLPPRIPVLEKLGIFDGTREMKVRKSNIESKYKDSMVKIVNEYTERNVEMATVKVNMYKQLEAEGKYFWFGTDYLGRSMWTRLWRGARVSLFIAALAAVINVVIGVIYGSISGYYGGMVDMLMQRFIEIIAYIPSYVVLILFILYFGTGIFSLSLSLVMTGWVGTSVIIRAQFYRFKGQEYVLSSRTMGAKDRRLIFRHILPNGIGPVITSTSLAIPLAIFYESMLAYLGLGLQAPEPSIGVLLSEGQKVLLSYPYLTLFPGIVISLLMISFNLLGNGLRDAFNPTLRGN